MSRCSVGGRTRIYSKSQCLSKQLYKLQKSDGFQLDFVSQPTTLSTHLQTASLA